MDPLTPDDPLAPEADPLAPESDPLAPARPEAPVGYTNTQDGPLPTAIAETKVPEPKPTAMSMFGNSVAEDVRRIKEFGGSVPGKVGTMAVKAGMNIMGVNPVRAATRASQEAVTGQPITNPMKAEIEADGYVKPQAGKDVFNVSPTSYGMDPLEAGKAVVNTVNKAEPLDVNLPGDVSARQMVNYSTHQTTGRVLNWLQDYAGKPIAQMMLAGSRMAGEGIHDALDIPYDKPLVGLTSDEPKYVFPKGPDGKEDFTKPMELNPTYYEQPFIKGIDQDKELHEHVSRTMLETLGGPSIMLPAAQQETARQQMQREWGDTGAKTVEMGAGFVSTFPVMWLPGVGQLEKAVAAEEAVALETAAKGSPSVIKALAPKLASMAVKQQVKVQMAEGALQSYYLAASKKGSDVAVETGLGTAAGGLLGLAMGMYQAHKLPGVLSKALNPSVVVPAKTMEQVVAQIDEAFLRAKPVIRTKVNEPITGMRLQQEGNRQPTYEMAQKMAGEKMADQLRLPGQDLAPEMDFDLVQGGVTKPSFSKFTFDENGNYVLRDYEIVAGPGRPKMGPSKKTAHSTNVTAKYRDTLVKDADAVFRLANQNGRNIAMSAMNDEELAALDQLIKTSNVKNPQPASEGGTYDYMAPEQAANMGDIYAAQGGVGMSPAKRLRLMNVLNAYRGKRPVIMTMDEMGRLDFTEVPEATPRPIDDGVKPGDNVLVDGAVPAQVVHRGESSLTVELTDGQKVNIRKTQAVLDAQFRTKLAAQQRLDYYHQNPMSDATARPSGASVSPRTKAIVKASTDITPQDLLRWEGRKPIDLGWATAALRKMEQEGVLVHTGGGHFSPKVQSVTKPLDISMDGEFVYVGTGGPSLAPNDPHGAGVVGILRGKDPRTKGNYMVEMPQVREGVDVKGNYNKTKFVSVPEAEVRTMKPVGMADKSKVNPDIDMYGWTKPMPTQFVQASQGAIGDIEEMSKFWSRVAPQSLQGNLADKYGTLKGAMGGAMHTAQFDVRTSVAQKMFSAAQVMKGEAMSTADMLAHKLGGIGSPANVELTQVLESAAARSPTGVAEGIDPAKLQAWAAKYPKEAAASLSDVKNLVAQRDMQSNLLVQYGIPQVAAAEGARDELAAYLTRNYAAFNMPREDWAKFARKNLTTEWHELMDYMTKARPDLQASQHAANIDTILRLDDPIQGFKDEGYIKAEAKGKLNEKIEVPLPIRNILGEFKDASTRLAFTVAYQRQLLKGIEGWSAIAGSKNLWSPGWRPDMTLPIPDDPLFGSARNGFVNDNASMRQLVGGKKLSNVGDSVAFLQATGWLGQRWKAAHTVWNPVAWANNTLRGVKTMVFSGGFLGPQDFDGFREASAMLKDYANDPTIYGRNKLLVEAMDFDAVGPGLAGAELGLAQKKFQRAVFDSVINAKGVSMFDLFSRKLHEVAMAVPESVHNGYDSIDKVVKLGCYLNIRRRFIAQGMSIDDAAAMASLRVNQSAQNFAQTPEWLKRTVGAGNFSLMAPFASSKLEDVRINATVLARVAKTLDPTSLPHEKEYDLLARLAGFSALMGGAATLAVNTRRMNGISDAEDDAQRASIPMRTKQYHPMLLGSLDYDEKGRRVFYPFEQNEDLAMAFRGNVNDPALVTFMMNNLLEVVGQGTVIGTGVEAGMGSTGLYTPRQPMPPPRPDQKGLLDTAQRLGKPFMPQGAVNAYGAYQGMQPQGHLVNPEPLTMDQALVHSLGGPQPIPVGPQSISQSNMENVGTVLEAKDNVTRAAKEAALQGQSEQRRRYIIKANIDEMKKKMRQVPRSLKEKP